MHRAIMDVRDANAWHWSIKQKILNLSNVGTVPNPTYSSMWKEYLVRGHEQKQWKLKN